MIELTKAETDRLRSLFWAVQEFKLRMQTAIDEIGKAHKLDPSKGVWNLSGDLKRLEKVK